MYSLFIICLTCSLRISASRRANNVDALETVEMLSGDLGLDGQPLRDDAEVTASGCMCTDSGCGATYLHGKAACDWCWTKDNCGQRAFRGHWDYCVYPKMEAYESLEAEEKRDELWQELTAPNVVGKSGPQSGVFATLTSIMRTSMITTFDDQWDVMPKARTKVIHQNGVHCKFDLDVSSQSFTGLFAAGKTQGLIRFGSATPLDGLGGKIFPGFAVKFLRTGRMSANFVALSPGGTDENFNFFWKRFSNQVAPKKALQKLGKFQQASGCIDQVGLSDVCKYGQDGAEVDDPVFPYEVMFEPVVGFDDSEYHGDQLEDKQAYLLSQLAGLNPGTQVFDVYTHASPADKKAGKKKELLGKLTLTSQCVQSVFGDTKLFFRHQRMEEDFALRPEWIPDATHDGCDASKKPISEWQCVHAGRMASNEEQEEGKDDGVDEAVPTSEEELKAMF